MQWLGLQIDRKTGRQKMGIFMDSIDFNECLKKRKELEKEAESTAPEEMREEKVEEKKRKEISKVYSSMDGNSAYYNTHTIYTQKWSEK